MWFIPQLQYEIRPLYYSFTKIKYKFIVTENVEYEDEDIPSTSTEKCRFWPQCKNGNDCPYYHPDITCK